jgi:hypothetical protein
MPDSPATPANPTEADVYAAYQTLLDTLSAQAESCTDPDAVLTLNNAAQAVSDLLSTDNIAVLQANTAAFTALTPEMKKTNDQLSRLKDQIAAIATKIADVGKVLGAIDSVLAIASKF